MSENKTSDEWQGTMGFLEWSNTVISCINFTIEFSISLSLFYAFVFSKKPELKSSYFYFLFIGYFQNFLIGLFWQIQILVVYNFDTWLKYPAFFFQWFWPCFASFWTVILSLNRSLAIAKPILHKMFWTPRVTLISIVLMHIFPFTVGFILYNKKGCLFDIYRKDCDDVNQFAESVISYINGCNNLLSLVIILSGVMIYRSKIKSYGGIKNNRVEKLLLAQTFTFTIFNTIVFACYAVPYWNQGTFSIVATFIGSYIYLFQQYPPMFILFYASVSFRSNYMSFYGISKLWSGNATMTKFKTKTPFYGRRKKFAVNSTFSQYDSHELVEYVKRKNYVSYRYGKNSSIFTHSAFQAFVYVAEINEPNSNCIMNRRNFHLNNSLQVVSIFGIENSYLQTEICFWNFTVANNLSLKIVVNILDVNETAIITDDSGKAHPLLKSVLYLNGTTFAIHYVKIPRKNGGLAAFISAVNLTLPLTNTLLQVKIKYSDYYKKNLTHFSNYDPINGYTPNTIYSAQIIYKSKTVMSFDNPTPFTEYLADPIYLSVNGNKYLMDDTVQPLQVKKGNNVTVQFSSDRNIVAAGFDLIQNEHDCKCPPEEMTIPCKDTLIVTLTDKTYRSDMKYTFSFVAECQNKLIQVKIGLYLRDNAGDSFTLEANEKVVKTDNVGLTKIYDNVSFDQGYPKTKLKGTFIFDTSPNMFYPEPIFILSLKTSEPTSYAGQNFGCLVVMFIFTILL